MAPRNFLDVKFPKKMLVFIKFSCAISDSHSSVTLPVNLNQSSFVSAGQYEVRRSSAQFVFVIPSLIMNVVIVSNECNLIFVCNSISNNECISTFDFHLRFLFSNTWNTENKHQRRR